MLGLGTKVFGGLSIALLLSTLWFYSQYKSELAANEVLRSNITQLETSKEIQDKTIESLLQDQNLKTETIKAYETNNNQLVLQLSNSLGEINNLRATLIKRSMENPYGVGNMETDSWYELKTGKEGVGGENN